MKAGVGEAAVAVAGWESPGEGRVLAAAGIGAVAAGVEVERRARGWRVDFAVAAVVARRSRRMRGLPGVVMRRRG